MNKDEKNFEFDTDPDFTENFYKNIEKVINGDEIDEDQSVSDDKLNAIDSEDEESADLEQGEPSEDDLTEAIDDELLDINASLARQISEEMINIEAETPTKKKMSTKLKVTILSSLFCVIGFGLFLGFTKPGNKILMAMGIDIGGKIWATMTNDFDKVTTAAEDGDYIEASDKESDAPEIDASKIKWPEHSGNGRKEEGVYNILLLGEEAIGMGSARGRTDVIIVATLNSNTKDVKLTSLMRDTLVQIPGYQDNKLNSAFEKGGLDLLYETIALNFDLQLDGCVMVNFEKFEKIIDQLGGLEITLTAGEAKYLNTTNYISKPQYRNVKEGKQHMNGNQVLGYARVRKRATITGNNNDYGRTDRHRIVLNAIFEKYKTKSKVELASIMLNVLPMITTDIDAKAFELLLNTYIDMGVRDMEQLRIPANGMFTDNVKVRGMDVLIPDLEKNREVLQTFIFGNSLASNTVNGAGNTFNTGITNNAGTTNTTGNNTTGTNNTAGTKKTTGIKDTIGTTGKTASPTKKPVTVSTKAAID